MWTHKVVVQQKKKSNTQEHRTKMVKSLSEWTKSLNLQGSFSREKVFAVNSCVATVRNKSSDSSMSSSSSPSVQNETTTSSTSILPSSRISRHVSYFFLRCYQLLSPACNVFLSIRLNLLIRFDFLSHSSCPPSPRGTGCNDFSVWVESPTRWQKYEKD